VLVASRLKAQVNALTNTADALVVEGLAARYPDLDGEAKRRLRGYVEASLRSERLTLIHDIEDFEYVRTLTPKEADFGKWLQKEREACESRLARL
jgi:hypothetical protein